MSKPRGSWYLQMTERKLSRCLADCSASGWAELWGVRGGQVIKPVWASVSKSKRWGAYSGFCEWLVKNTGILQSKGYIQRGSIWVFLYNQKWVPGSWGHGSEVESLPRKPQVLGPIFSRAVFIWVSHRRELEPETLCEARITVWPTNFHNLRSSLPPGYLMLSLG